jgi:hypothetical protein
MILRFATRPGPAILSSNEAQRTIRPVKVRQRSSGGCWRTLQSLAGFAVVQSCLPPPPRETSVNPAPSAPTSAAAPGCHPPRTQPRTSPHRAAAAGRWRFLNGC